MSSGNRTVKYENLLKSLKKHYKPLAEPPQRSVLEHLLYACCLEDARVEQADEGFAKLQQTYFDWNEVRVTTAVELAEALKPLPFPMQAASRIKQCLQSIFETRYQYDIDDMKKANLGKATAELEAWKGISPFVVSYVSQHALGGHSIPASNLICEAMWQCEILTLGELQKTALPGIERAIPKNKGVEFAGLLHQFASDLYHHPRSAAPSAVLKEMGVSYKSKPKVQEESVDSKSKGTGKVALAKPTVVPPTPPNASDSKKPSATQAASGRVTGTGTDPKGKQDAKVAKVVVPAKPAGKEQPLAKSASKSAESSKSPRTNGVKPQNATSGKSSTAKPSVVKPESSKVEKNAKGIKGKPEPVKAEKGKGDKGQTGKSQSGKPPTQKGKPDKTGSDKTGADKAKAHKGGSNKAGSHKLEGTKGKSDSGKSDKHKSLKKDSKPKGPSKPSKGSLSTSITKKKPR
jgi:hypothetical protein